MLLCHGRSLLGKLEDDPTTLAQTELVIMIVYLYGGPKFLSKRLPIVKLNQNLLIEQVDVKIQSIATGGVH